MNLKSSTLPSGWWVLPNLRMGQRKAAGNFDEDLLIDQVIDTNNTLKNLTFMNYSRPL